jgi:putative ABC transport system permease protein
LLAAGAFAITPRAVLPTAGILIGGAMVATTLTGRRLLEALVERADEIEARLCLGDSAREATDGLRRTAVRGGVIPVIDQTRSAGLVTLPGTFVGLLLGGASPKQAALTQLLVLTALLFVELASALLVAELMLRASIAPGERVLAPDVPRADGSPRGAAWVRRTQRGLGRIRGRRTVG